jgi:hypothetical protein
VNLVLAILFLWIGCALLTVAFHQLSTESLITDPTGHALGPSTLASSLQAQIAQHGSAYDVA